MSEGEYLQFGIPDVPFSAVRVPIGGDAATVAANLEIALKTATWFHAKFIAAFPPPARPEPAQRPQGSRSGGGRPQQRRGGGSGTSRTDRFEQTDGECDICGGPVGIYPRTGNMRSDKIVCLGKCKDDEYVHTVAWMDEDSGGYQEPDSMPF